MNGQWQLAFIIVTALIITVVIASSFYFSDSSSSSLGDKITVSKDGDITTPGVITASNISPTNKADIEALQTSVSTLSGEVGGFNGRITSLETKTDQITIDGNTTVFTQNVEILGDLNVMGTVTANNTEINVFEYLQVNQNPTDSVTPGLKIAQASPFNGHPIVVTSPGGSTVFEVQNDGSVVAPNLSGVNTGDQLLFSSIGGVNATSKTSTLNFVGTGAVNITPNQGNGSITFGVDLTPIEGEISTLSGTVGTLQSEVGTIQTDVTTLSGTVGTIQSEVTTLSGTVGTLQNEVGTLQTDFSSLDTTVTGLSGEVSALSGEVSALSGEVTTISGNVSSLSGEVSTISGNVSSLTSRVTATEGTIITLQGEVATLSGDVGTLQTDVTTLQGETSTLQGEVTTLSGTVGTLQTNVTTLSGTVGTLQTNVTTLSGTVGTLQTNVTTLSGTVGTLDNRTQYLSSNTTSSTFSKELIVQGNLQVQGTTTTNDSQVNVYDGYVQIIQNPADGITPALDIIQTGTATGSIMRVKDGDSNTIFSINQNADISTDGSITSKGNLIVGTPSTFQVNATSGNLTTSGTIGGSNFTGSVSGTNTGDQDVFNQFTVQGNSVVIADSTTTNVTLIPGSGIGIVADNAAKTLTFTSTASGSIFDPTTKTYSVQTGVWNTPGDSVGISTLQGNPGNLIPMDISSTGLSLFKNPINTSPYVYIYNISTNSWSFITTVGSRTNNILAKAFGNYIVVGCRGNDGVSTIDLYNYTAGNAVFVSNIGSSSSIIGYTGISFSNNYLSFAYTNSSTFVSSVVLKQFNAGVFTSVGSVINLPVILDANCSIQICPNPSGVIILPNSTSKVIYFISSSPFTSITQLIFFTDNIPAGWTYSQDMSFAVDNSYFYLLNPGVSSNRGAVAVFNWNGSSWTRIVNYVLTNASVNDYFGRGTAQGELGNEVSFFNSTNSILNICSYSSNKVLQYSVTKTPSLNFTYIGVTTPQFSGTPDGFFSFSPGGDYLSYFPYNGGGVKNVQIFNSLISSTVNYESTTDNVDFSGRVLMDGAFVALPTNTSAAISSIIATGEDINGMSYVDSSTGATLTRFNGQWNSTRGTNTGDQLTFTSIGGVSADSASTSLTVNSGGSITVTPNNGTKTLSLDVSSSITNPIQNISATSGNTNFNGTLNTTGNLTVATNKAIINATSGNATFTGVVSGSNVTATNSTDITALQGKTQNQSATVGTTSFTGAVAVGTSSAPSTGAALDVGNATSSLIVPKGTTGQQPTPVAGMIRYNTTTSSFEGASGAGPSWTSLGGGGPSWTTVTDSQNIPGNFSGQTVNLSTTPAGLVGAMHVVCSTENYVIYSRQISGFTSSGVVILYVYSNSSGILTYQSTYTLTTTMPTNVYGIIGAAVSNIVLIGISGDDRGMIVRLLYTAGSLGSETSFGTITAPSTGCYIQGLRFKMMTSVSGTDYGIMTYTRRTPSANGVESWWMNINTGIRVNNITLASGGSAYSVTFNYNDTIIFGDYSKLNSYCLIGVVTDSPNTLKLWRVNKNGATTPTTTWINDFGMSNNFPSNQYNNSIGAKVISDDTDSNYYYMHWIYGYSNGGSSGTNGYGGAGQTYYYNPVTQNFDGSVKTWDLATLFLGQINTNSYWGTNNTGSLYNQNTNNNFADVYENKLIISSSIQGAFAQLSMTKTGGVGSGIVFSALGNLIYVNSTAFNNTSLDFNLSPSTNYIFAARNTSPALPISIIKGSAGTLTINYFETADNIRESNRLLVKDAGLFKLPITTNAAVSSAPFITDGYMYIDENGNLKVRIGGVWKTATLT